MKGGTNWAWKPGTRRKRTAEKERQADEKQSDSVVTEAYGQVRVGAHQNAWALLQSWLASRGHAPEDYLWVREKVVAWPDARYADRLTEEYVDRLSGSEARRRGARRRARPLTSG